MEANPITYGDLYRRLEECGFSSKRFEWKGNSWRYFCHPDDETATVDLPDTDPSEPAERLHMLGVRSMLLVHEFIDPNDLLRPSVPENAGSPGSANGSTAKSRSGESAK